MTISQQRDAESRSKRLRRHPYPVAGRKRQRDPQGVPGVVGVSRPVVDAVREKSKESSDVLSGVLLSHGLRRSTIGAGGLNCRVRNGIGCTPSAKTTEHIRRLYVGIAFTIPF